jgi:pilus assembly protein CpaB
MNRNRLLMIGVVALALGLFVSTAVYNNLKAKGQPANQSGVEVLVAAKDLAVGSKINSDDLKIVRIPEGAFPPTVVRHKADVLERGVIIPISAGEFILTNKLAAEKAGAGLPSLIPPGMRAMSVRVNEVVSVAGFVLPGTRVDVLLTGNPSGGGDQQTTTVLENVAVLATGQKLERNSAGDPENAAVITLLVSPDDAQKLTLASSQGRIQLSLRNPLDTKQQDLGLVSTNSLYRGSAPPPVRVTASRPKTKSVMTVPSAPQVYAVEVIRGDKKEETKF